MGFIGRLRGHVLKSFEKGALDVAAASKVIVADAKKTVTHVDIGSFFSTKYLRDVNGTPMLGNSGLFDFIRASRIGDFRTSFGRAFPNVAALENRQVRNAVNNLLTDARNTLPDVKIARNADRATQAKQAYGITGKRLTTADEIQTAVSSNAKFRNDVERLVQRTNRTKQLKLFGVSFALGAGVVTAAAIYDLLVEAAKKETGCFAYWTEGGGNNNNNNNNNNDEIKRCKVRSYSCQSPLGEIDCLASIIPASISGSKECEKEENKQKPCVHCDNSDPLNADLPENVTLSCEEKTAGDMLVDAINNTVGSIASAASNWFNWLIIVAVVVVVAILVIIVATRLI